MKATANDAQQAAKDARRIATRLKGAAIALERSEGFHNLDLKGTPKATIAALKGMARDADAEAKEEFGTVRSTAGQFESLAEGLNESLVKI